MSTGCAWAAAASRRARMHAARCPRGGTQGASGAWRGVGQCNSAHTACACVCAPPHVRLGHPMQRRAYPQVAPDGTPLMEAAACGCEALIACLLQHGADPRLGVVRALHARAPLTSMRVMRRAHAGAGGESCCVAVIWQKAPIQTRRHPSLAAPRLVSCRRTARRAPGTPAHCAHLRRRLAVLARCFARRPTARRPS